MEKPIYQKWLDRVRYDMDIDVAREKVTIQVDRL